MFLSPSPSSLHLSNAINNFLSKWKVWGVGPSSGLLFHKSNWNLVLLLEAHRQPHLGSQGPPNSRRGWGCPRTLQHDQNTVVCGVECLQCLRHGAHGAGDLKSSGWSARWTQSSGTLSWGFSGPAQSFPGCVCSRGPGAGGWGRRRSVKEGHAAESQHGEHPSALTASNYTA